MIGWTHHPARRPNGTASGGQMKATSPAVIPRAEASGTKGAAARLAIRPVVETVPAIQVTTGWVASWAAHGTVTAAANQVGTHAIAVVQGRAHHKIPAVAQADSQNPTDRTSHGSTSMRLVTATAKVRTPPRRSKDTPVAAMATAPMAAARTTDASARHTATKPTTPITESTRNPRLLMPHHAPIHHSKAVVDARLAPETAMRWVNAVTRKSSDISSETAAVSPTTKDGTMAR